MTATGATALARAWFSPRITAVVEGAQKLAIRLILLVIWPFRRPGRMLWLAWMVGFFAVGQAGSVYADDIIPAPGVPDGQAATPFESMPLGNYELIEYLSDSHHGAPYVEQSMWGIINGISNVMLYMTFSFVRGAITCMQWMLQLNIYQENKYEIDAAVLSLADQIFWPLFATTLAIAGCAMYVRSKREGGGSITNDLVWVLAASVLAVTFAGIPGSESRYTPQQQQDCLRFGECPDTARLGPSAIMSDLDDLRRLLALGAIKGFAGAPQTSASAAGFKPTEFGTGTSADPSQPGLTETNAVRKLADSMWNVYAVTPWCFAQFNSLAACKFDAKGDGIGEGAHYLLRDAVWQERQDFLRSNSDDEDAAGNDGGAPKCPSEWSADGAGGGVSPGQCDWIRGQSFGRLGVVFLMTLISLPMALLLLALVLFAVMSIVGFILLILIGLVFLLGWMIPGRLRQIGVRWFETVLATLLQSVIITTVLGGVMVLGGILNAGIPKYGFFMVALLHFGTFIAAFKVRGHFESITQMSSPTSSAPVSQYMAMKLLSSAGRVGRFAGRKGDQALTGLGSAAHSSTVQAGRGIRQYGRDAMAGSLRPLMPRAAMAANRARDGLKVAFPPPAGQGAGGGPGRAAGAGLSPVSPAGSGPGRGSRAGRGSGTSAASVPPPAAGVGRGEAAGSDGAAAQRSTAVRPVTRLRPQGEAYGSTAPARDPYAPTRSVTPPNQRRTGVGGPSVRSARSAGTGASGTSARPAGPARPVSPVRPATERATAPTQPGGATGGRGVPADPYQPTRTVRPPSRPTSSAPSTPGTAAPSPRPSVPVTPPAGPTPPAVRPPAPRRPSPGSETQTPPPSPPAPPGTRGTGPWRSQPPRHRRDDDGRSQ